MCKIGCVNYARFPKSGHIYSGFFVQGPNLCKLHDTGVGSQNLIVQTLVSSDEFSLGTEKDLQKLHSYYSWME